jgi:hypothetical protein
VTVARMSHPFLWGGFTSSFAHDGGVVRLCFVCSCCVLHGSDLTVAEDCKIYKKKMQPGPRATLVDVLPTVS